MAVKTDRERESERERKRASGGAEVVCRGIENHALAVSSSKAGHHHSVPDMTVGPGNNQLAGDQCHKPDSRLLLLSARPGRIPSQM